MKNTERVYYLKTPEGLPVACFATALVDGAICAALSVLNPKPNERTGKKDEWKRSAARRIALERCYNPDAYFRFTTTPEAGARIRLAKIMLAHRDLDHPIPTKVREALKVYLKRKEDEQHGEQEKL